MVDFTADCLPPHPRPLDIARFGMNAGRVKPTVVPAAQSAWRSDETRFGSAVVPMPNGCWAFTGDLRNNGQFCRWPCSGAPQETIRAHRYAYETLVGPIPADHHLHHECQNPGCVNPAHLVPLTPGDHARRHAELRRAS